MSDKTNSQVLIKPAPVTPGVAGSSPVNRAISHFADYRDTAATFSGCVCCPFGYRWYRPPCAEVATFSFWRSRSDQCFVCGAEKSQWQLLGNRYPKDHPDRPREHRL